jgi:tetratricopeptide (TPR) repeat protein
MLLAAAQEELGRIAEAIDTLEATLRANPAFLRAQVRLIELYERSRRWKEAAEAYARAQSLNPKADLTGGRAAALINAGETKQAQALLQQAIDDGDKPDASLLYLLAEAQRQSDDLAAASATAARLRAAFPDDVRGIVIEAQLQLAQGQRDEALATFGCAARSRSHANFESRR